MYTVPTQSYTPAKNITLLVVHIIHFLWCGMGKMVEYSPWHVCTALSCIDPHSVALAHALYSVRGADP